MIAFVLCDDERSHNDALEQHLLAFIHEEESAACNVALKATDIAEVLAYATAEHPQTVYLLDINMEREDMNGIDLCRQLHQLDPDGYIIYVSAYPEYAMECCQSHAYDYVLKPFSQARLNACLRAVVQEIGRRAPMRLLEVKVGNCVYRSRCPISPIYRAGASM